MTATPHNGKEEDFQLFMGLLDADRFEGRFREGVHKVDPSDMMRRLTKEELLRFDGSPLFPERRAYTVSYELSSREAELYEAVTRYVREEMNRADRISEDGSRRRNNVGFALQILQRRLASSPAAIHESLRRRLARLEGRLEEVKLGRAVGRAIGDANLLSGLEATLDEEDLEEATGEELEAHEERLLDRATAAQTIAELEAETAELRELESMARALRRSGEDAKWRELDRILDAPLVYDPGRDVRRKVVVFTEARDTLEYLARRIRDRTGEPGSVAVIHGSVPRDRRRATIASFNDDIDSINGLVARNKLTREGLDPMTVQGVREEMERAAARRLQPHHVRSFFEVAFAEAGGVLRAREKGRFEVTRVPPALRERDRLIGRTDPVLPRYRRICFDKEHVPGQPQAALVAPGHPLLDSLIDLTLERHRDLLTRGAFLVDEGNRHDGPRVLVALRHAIRDGRTTRQGRPQTISERLHFVWLDSAGRAVDGGPAPHLDCRPAGEEEREKAAELLVTAWFGEPLEDRARTLAITELVPRHLREVRERRLPELDKTESAVKERMRREITHLQHRALELEAEERAGRRPRLNSENMFRQCEAMTDRLALRLADIARQRDIAPSPPEVCAAALVVPARLVRAEEEDKEAVNRVADRSDPATRAEVETKAMQAVMDRERALGFEPIDVSSEDRGYDIESRDPASGRLRFIEVKGRRADARTVSITRNEMLAAFNATDSFILAVVLVEGNFVHYPLYLPNPAPVFGPEPGFNEVSRAISAEAIKRAVRGD